MNDGITDTGRAMLPAAKSEPSPERRGRKSETPAQRMDRLKRQLAEATIAAREAERRMFAVVGEALLAESAEDPALKIRITEILRRRVTTTQAKADIATLLVGG